MSHFTCLVIGADIDARLQPFHEFECTGTSDEYVQNVDKLAAAREEYAKASACIVIQRPDGTRVFAFNKEGNYIDEFRQFFDPITRRLNLPGGYTELRDEPLKDWQTFADWAPGEYGVSVISATDIPDLEGEQKYGWARVNGSGELIELIDRTNPNAKWDWWTIGGRWPDRLLLKDGTRTSQATKGMIDFEGMRAAAEADAAKEYDTAATAIAGREFVSWKQMRENYPGNVQAARAAYHAQPAIEAFNQAFEGHWFGPSAEDFLVPRDAYITSHGLGDIAMHAVLKDGQWHERGEMGWFGCVSNEKGPLDWGTKFSQLIDDVSDDVLLTVVDCHI